MSSADEAAVDIAQGMPCFRMNSFMRVSATATDQNSGASPAFIGWTITGGGSSTARRVAA